MDFSTHAPVEARAWLTVHREGFAFAVNRFGRTENALAFVEALYAEGATEILIDDPRVDSEGGPHADTLLVGYSGDCDIRWRLERFCEREGPGEVPDDFTLHQHGDVLRLWWD